MLMTFKDTPTMSLSPIVMTNSETSKLPALPSASKSDLDASVTQLQDYQLTQPGVLQEDRFARCARQRLSPITPSLVSLFDYWADLQASGVRNEVGRPYERSNVSSSQWPAALSLPSVHRQNCTSPWLQFSSTYSVASQNSSICSSLAEQRNCLFSSNDLDDLQSLQNDSPSDSVLPLLDASELEAILSDVSLSPGSSPSSIDGSSSQADVFIFQDRPSQNRGANNVEKRLESGSPVKPSLITPSDRRPSASFLHQDSATADRPTSAGLVKVESSQSQSVLAVSDATGSKEQTMKTSAPGQCEAPSTSSAIMVSCPARAENPNKLMPGLLQNFQIEGYPVLSLWEFLLECLHYPCYAHIIHWCSRQDGIFKISDSRRLAAMWGIYKGKKEMTFDKLSRAMRYYYTNGMLGKCRGCARLVYKFGERSSWLAFQPASDARPGRFLRSG